MLRSRFSWITVACLILAAAFFVGCSMDSGNPVAPAVGDTDGLTVQDERADVPQFVTFAQPRAKMLGNDKEKKDNQKDNEHSNRDHTKQKISKKKGGTLEFGDEQTIKVQLKVAPVSIRRNTTISVTLPAEDMLVVGINLEDGLVFGPHGLTFDPPARLTIKSKYLVLPEGELALYYFNEVTGEWELIDSPVEVTIGDDDDDDDDLPMITIRTWIPHFSHYAFGVRR